MEQYTLKAIWKAMMMVVHEYGLENDLPEKYHHLSKLILNYEDIDVIDMIDNMETVYKLIDTSIYDVYENEE